MKIKPRMHRRIPLGHEGTLTWSQGTSPCVIHEASMGGLQITLSSVTEGLAIDQSVSIQLAAGTLQLPATIVHFFPDEDTGMRIGLQFSTCTTSQTTALQTYLANHRFKQFREPKFG